MRFFTRAFAFNNIHYTLSGRCLLNIFPYKPKSTSTNNYNNSFVFSELDMINDLRNRIAHHESICFKYPYSIDLIMIKRCYDSMIMFFEWMQISHKRLLCGFDHIDEIAEKIKKISEN